MPLGTDKPIIQDGFITVPGAAGLGVELNEDLARRYAKPGELFFGEPVEARRR